MRLSKITGTIMDGFYEAINVAGEEYYVRLSMPSLRVRQWSIFSASLILWVTMIVESWRSRHSSCSRFKNKISGSGVKIAGRFIGQQKLRVHDQGSGKSCPLLFTA